MMVREFSLNSEEVFRTFEVIIMITKSIKCDIITKMLDLKDCWIIETQFELVFCVPGSRKIIIKRGINNFDKRRNKLKGGELIPIKIKIYGIELSMFIIENSLSTKHFYFHIIS
jgi:hypothetical protein